MEISDFPTAEDDCFEFKSSATPTSELKKKIGRGVTGFANSGGGVFIVGVDNDGNPDGGVSAVVGTTPIRDWIDQIIHRIEPSPKVEIHLIDDAGGRGNIHPNHSVVAIDVAQSLIAPHMASDNRYYIRAGAHTLPARHFIVEGIWSRRHFSHPQLVHIARVLPFGTDHSQCCIEIIALNDSPALDVRISADYDPKPDYWPREVPLIDKSHSFAVGFEVPISGAKFNLRVDYNDVAGNPFDYAVEIDTQNVHNSYKPYEFGGEPLRDIASAIEHIERKLN